jgi:hypothetical protein
MHNTPLEVVLIEYRIKANKSPGFLIKEANLLSVHYGSKKEREKAK